MSMERQLAVAKVSAEVKAKEWVAKEVRAWAWAGARARALAGATARDWARAIEGVRLGVRQAGRPRRGMSRRRRCRGSGPANDSLDRTGVSTLPCGRRPRTSRKRSCSRCPGGGRRTPRKATCGRRPWPCRCPAGKSPCRPPPRHTAPSSGRTGPRPCSSRRRRRPACTAPPAPVGSRCSARTPSRGGTRRPRPPPRPRRRTRGARSRCGGTTPPGRRRWCGTPRPCGTAC
mmetsp:Transcript_25142/g.43046  ORF Transcript_25142/g.43046 Transcript_25142/m.43046 type:complete len:231 (-) Transcript_25142:1155-1847(-)